MTSKKSFKQEFTFKRRVEESTRMLSKYPDRRPVICEKAMYQPNLPNIETKKYLIPYEFTFAEFMYVIRKKMKLREDEGIFLFTNNQIVTSSSVIGEMYEHSKDPDGFLYVKYAKENTFG